MDENEFEVGGVVYVATDPKNALDGCSGCSFDECGECYFILDRASCTPRNRIDKRYVIFVEKQQ
ncbi:MAG: hypothetical protein ACRCXB_34330 [Aeromonadaceae bacterium]